MRLLVCGSREWTDRERVEREIVRFGAPLVVIHGAAPGADSIADDFARAIMHDVEPFPADWKRDGKAAGPMRNARMLADGKPDRGLAFGPLWWFSTVEDRSFGVVAARWKRTGTGDMVQRMLRAGLPVRWIAAPDAPAVDITAMPAPPR